MQSVSLSRLVLTSGLHIAYSFHGFMIYLLVRWTFTPHIVAR